QIVAGCDAPETVAPCSLAKRLRSRSGNARLGAHCARRTPSEDRSVPKGSITTSKGPQDGQPKYHPRMPAAPTLPHSGIPNDVRRSEIGRFLAQRYPPSTLAQWHNASRLIRTLWQSMGYSEKALCHATPRIWHNGTTLGPARYRLKTTLRGVR